MMPSREMLLGIVIGLALFYAWCYARAGKAPWPIQLSYDKIGQARTFRNQIVPRADNPTR